MSLLRRYIREAIDMGQVQFSPNRTDGANKDEPNTPEEDELYNDLFARIKLGRHLTPKNAQIIIDLLDSRYGQAPGGSGFFVEPPQDQQLYRGQSFDVEWLKKHVSPNDMEKLIAASNKLKDSPYTPTRFAGIKLKDDVTSGNLVTLVGDYQFTQMRGWSKDPGIATNFASTYGFEGDTYFNPSGIDPYKPPEMKKAHAAVVLVTSPAESGTRFLDFEASMYRTGATSIALKAERECVNLGPVTVRQAAIAIIDKA